MQLPGEYRHIAVKPVSGAIGAEVHGIDLSAGLTDFVVDEVKQAFADHMVLFFRDQVLTPEQFAAVGERFGPLGITSYARAIGDGTKVHRNVREASAKWSDRNFGDNWHIDQSIRPEPNAIFALYAVECPPYGGDTMFANLYRAYDTLSPGLQRLCEKLTVIHSPAGLYGPEGKGGKGVKKAMPVESFDITPEQVQAHLAKQQPHPLISRHPVTGRKVLYITGPYCVRFQDMTEEESEPLLAYLYRHCSKPEFTCRFRWEPGSMAVIDNRCVLHFAIQDYAGYRRELLRLETVGEPVVPACDVWPSLGWQEMAN